MFLKRVLAVSGVLGMLMGLIAGSATPAAASPALLGAFRGGMPDALAGYEAWLGRPVNVGLTFEAYDTWADIEGPDWLLDPWAAWVKADPNRTLVLSIPMIPGRPVSDAENSSMMDQGASGAFDSHFRTLAQRLVAKGLGNTILRIGSEFNGAWTPYRANVNPTAWVQYYRRISQTMTSVAGNSFRVDWNPNHGSGDIAWQDVYPGDDVVDIIGMDYYDQSWSHYENNGLIAGHTREQAWQEAVTAPGGLQDHADFAARHGKPISFPEWGLMARADGHGGGDNPYYVQKMREWIDSHNVAYFSYFEFDAPDGDHELARSDTRFPNASATYRQLFGPDATTGGQTSTPPQDQPADPGSCATGEWQAQYFTGRTASGTPVYVTCEAAIDHHWGSGGPGNGVPTDDFSAHWTQTMDLPAGDHTFEVTADDGVRVILDGTTIIDGWRDQSATTYTATRTLTAGPHTVEVEYYEHGWDATAVFTHHTTGGQTSTPPQDQPADPGSCATGEWQAQYFTGRTASGTPVYVTCEAAIDHHWGSGGPGNGVPTDDFSAHWTQTMDLPAGDHTFEVTADDGVRVILDGTTIIDGWRDQSATTYTATRTLTAGPHTVEVEYYEHGWDATAVFTHHTTGGQTSTPPQDQPADPGSCATGEWQAQYFTGRTASGTPVYVTCEAAIDHHWGSGGPGNGVPTDDFSAHWTQTMDLPAGDHTFEVTADDGVRVILDGTTIIDGWRDQSATTYTATRTLTAGPHTVEVEYYEHGWDATAVFTHHTTA